MEVGLISGTLIHLAVASVAFVGTHFLLSSQPLRGILAGAFGEGMFKILFSLWAAVLLGWMILAYVDAPYVELWPITTGKRHLAMGVMLPASILLAAGVTSYNPTAIGIDRLARPENPVSGIIKVTRHPVMWATGLWAIVHMIANGDAASLILFGALAFLALAGTVTIDRKKRATMGQEAWTAFAEETSNIPFAALARGRCRVSLGEIGYGRLVFGVALYLALLFGHGPVVGIAPYAT